MCVTPHHPLTGSQIQQSLTTSMLRLCMSVNLATVWPTTTPTVFSAAKTSGSVSFPHVWPMVRLGCILSHAGPGFLDKLLYSMLIWYRICWSFHEYYCVVLCKTLLICVPHLSSLVFSAHQTSSGKCGKNNGGCQQVCESTGDGGKQCVCYKGFRLNEDGITCQGE